MVEQYDTNKKGYRSRFARRCYDTLGFTTLALGVVGVFVPLLPTTPFLLVALFAFSKSRPNMSAKILRNRYLSPYVTSYVSGDGLSVAQKVRILSLMWLVMLVSAIFATDNLWVRLALLFIGLCVTIHIVTYGGRRKKRKN